MKGTIHPPSHAFNTLPLSRFASLIRSNCRAIVAGEGSFGKGLIQAVYGLSDGSGLVLTVAKYETPRGESIQGVGVQPDVKEVS